MRREDWQAWLSWSRLTEGEASLRFSFADCVLDLVRRELRRGGAVVQTRAKVFDMLSYLVTNRDRVLSREELLEYGWPGLTVSDGTLSSCIQAVRQAIGDDGRSPRHLKTLRGQGFRFVAEVRTEDAPKTQTGSNRVTGGRNPAHARDDSLSIAVLPFANLNNDPNLDYLVAGLAEDVTTALSRFKAFTVIVQSSSFQYRSPDIDARSIGAELQVDYILQGNVRCDGENIRTTAQLIHAPTTTHIWAENYDSPIDRLIALRDDITQRIATNVKPEIDFAEIHRAWRPHRGEPRAQEMAWRARALLERSRLEADPALFAQSMELAEQAAADPNCRQAWWTIFLVNYLVAFARLGDDPAKQLARAREAAEKLRALDRNDHSAYTALGWVNHIERNFESALSYLNQTYALNPNCTMTLMFLAFVLISVGRPEAGYEHLSRAIRMSPRNIWFGFMIGSQAWACFAMGRYKEGVDLTRRAIEREPNASGNHILLAACLSEHGDLDGAAAAIRRQREISATYLQEYLERKRLPFQVPELAERYAAALIRAAAAADAN